MKKNIQRSYKQTRALKIILMFLMLKNEVLKTVDDIHDNQFLKETKKKKNKMKHFCFRSNYFWIERSIQPKKSQTNNRKGWKCSTSQVFRRICFILRIF